MSYFQQLEYWTSRIAIYLIYIAVFCFEIFVLANFSLILYKWLPKSVSNVEFEEALFVSIISLTIALLIFIFKLTVVVVQKLVHGLIDRGVLSELE
jgi:hypothetical protein